MQRNTTIVAALLTLLVGMNAPLALADPCGMVPPIYTGNDVPISRIGLQQTYVFYKDGIETFVIRPGFTGKVEEFGMLIPFPTPPAIRKVPDHVFDHIAAAVDPPEVVVDLRQLFLPQASAAPAGPRRAFKADGLMVEDEVRVLRQEAVGMYEVAVLEAGSSAALKKWMDQHGYKYPDGMDKPCDEYVKAKWCFVAVKTKVGEKKGIDPRPGQRNVNAKLPAGSTFDGHVQGMGFRFAVDDLVVPMRLSAFNKGELRNIVYLLTDGPRKIRAIPEEYVMRQISGEQLIKNVTDPLPLRIIGGTEKDIPEYRLKLLKTERDPTPKNGAAKELFASDLLAVKLGELSLPHEEREKELLRIGERFGLRGGDIDKLNVAALTAERDKTVAAALSELKNMTLTVVDGDFPRELLAAENLTFAEYKMPANRNKSEAYDPKLNAPAPKKEGILKLGALAPLNSEPTAIASADENSRRSESSQSRPWLLSLLGIILVGLVFVARRKVGRAAAVILVAAASLLATSAAIADDAAEAATDEEAQKPTIRELMKDLSDAAKADAAVQALVAQGDEAKEQLFGEAIEGNDVTRRGWAIVALAEIGGQDVDELLLKVHNDGNQPPLVRTWAAAARVYMTSSTEALIEKASLVASFPALGRPIGMRIIEQLNADDKQASPESILSVSLKVPTLQQALVPAILALGPQKLTTVLTTADDQEVRRQAAAYLGTLAQQGDEKVASSVIEAYKFDPKAKQVPWHGGPLFLPGINWQKDDATKLVGNLIAWHLWSDRKGKSAEQNQIHNNIRSIGLSNVVGYQTPNFQAASSVEWLEAWGKAVGKKEIERILTEQGVQDDAKYSAVLEKL